MIPPFISYVTFNRLGLIERNIKALLDTPEDFELHIIDSNSKDGTWKFIKSLRDPRIKSKKRLKVNSGPVYALNLNLTKRKPDQYFFTVDSDVFIKTKDWLSRFIEVFETFPEVGVLGVMRGNPYIPLYPDVIHKTKDGVSYLELKNCYIDGLQDFVHGCCQGLRPELIKEIGYWSEECYWGDAELSPRVMHYTNFKVGYMSDAEKNSHINIDMTQTIDCNSCMAKKYCKLDKVKKTCFEIYNQAYKNEEFVNKYKWKYLAFFKELEEGQRTAYCSSILDPASIKNHVYHKDWAMENIKFYVDN